MGLANMVYLLKENNKKTSTEIKKRHLMTCSTNSFKTDYDFNLLL